MSNIKEKLRRQTEILGICLSEKDGYLRADLELVFERDRPTINRDLKDLRSMGIDIHSTKRHVKLTTKMRKGAIVEHILQYAGLSYTNLSYDKATGHLVDRLKEKALVYFVTLQRAIDRSQLVSIDYEKRQGEVVKDKVTAPYFLYQSDNEWRLLAEDGGAMKQYIVSKIRGVKPTAKTFRKPAADTIRDMFSQSWNSWTGGERYPVRIHFDERSMQRYGHRQFVKGQKWVCNDDGSAVLEAQVNVLTEVAAWVVSRGTGIKVLEPKQLQEEVVRLATIAIENHT